MLKAGRRRRDVEWAKEERSAAVAWRLLARTGCEGGGGDHLVGFLFLFCALHGRCSFFFYCCCSPRRSFHAAARMAGVGVAPWQRLLHFRPEQRAVRVWLMVRRRTLIPDTACTNKTWAVPRPPVGAWWRKL
jgi:hypothetical protein